MAVKDAIVLNTTGSNFEAIQGTDTVRIKGDSAELLSIQNSSSTPIFKVGTTNTSVTVTGNVTSSATISGSTASTASFGKFVATSYTGDGREIASTIPRSGNILSGSSQIAADVSGSFISGFTFGATADEYYVGVSGSNSSHSASISGSQRGMSVSGSVSNTLAALAGGLGDIQGSAGAGGTWSEGGALVASTGGSNGGGTGNAGIIVGGRTPNKRCTQLYDGTTWSLGTATPSDRGNTNYGGGWGFGLQDSFIDFSPTNDVQEYNGIAWSEVGNMTAPSISGDKSRGAGFNARTGIAMAVGASPYKSTEHYNGTSWSSGGDLISAGGNAHSGAGSEHSAMFILSSCVQEYNGSVWSLLNTQSFPFSGDAFGSKVDNVVAFGGSYGVQTSCAFDGTSWAATGNMIRGQFSSGGGTGGHNAGGGGFRTGGNASSPYQYGGSTCSENYSVTYKSTGSFGRIEAGYVLGNAEDIKGQIPRDAGLVTGSAQLAANISGSFISGFNFGATTDQFYTGISGSNSSHSASISGSTRGMSASGSDNTYLLQSEVGHLRGTVGTGTWSAGGSLITARQDLGGAGVQKAAIAYGGSTPTIVANTEHYNGSSWTAGGAMIIAKESQGSAGTENAALSIGGSTPSTLSNTEHYNGASWSASTSKINASTAGKAAGTENAGLQFGGNPSNACTEEYNGNVWTVGGALPQAICVQAGGFGLQNAALSAGGSTAASSPNNATTTLHYNGDTWSEGGAMIIARSRGASGGTENAGIVAGGITPSRVANTEHYDGTAWSVGGSMIIARGLMPTGGVGLQHSALGFGGGTPTIVANTEEYDANYTTTGSFGKLSGGFLFGDARNISSSLYEGTNIVSGSPQIAVDVSGSFDEGFNFGHTFESRFMGSSGSGAGTPGQSGSSAFYSSSATGHPSLMGVQLNSSGSDMSGSIYNAYGGEIRSGILGVWTAGTALPYTVQQASGTGTKDAFLMYGETSSPNASALEFNGSSWSAAGTIGSGSSRGTLFGTQNAGVATGRYPNSVSTKTEHYDGSSWSDGADSPHQQTGAGVGTQNAGFHHGGFPSPYTQTRHYDGTAWSSNQNSNVARFAHGAAGSQYAAIIHGSGNPSIAPDEKASELYDGTSWTVISDTNTSERYRGVGMGTVNDYLVVGGPSQVSEHYDGSAWSIQASLSNTMYSAGGDGATGLSGIMAGGSPGTNTELWTAELHATGSFGRIKADYFNGDFSNMSASLYLDSNAVSGSKQLATDISGSFISGFNFGVTADEFYRGVSGSNSSHSASISGSQRGIEVSGSDYPYLSDIGQITSISGPGTWTAGGAVITGAYKLFGTGVQNAAIKWGGYDGSVNRDDIELYDGTSWSAGGAGTDIPVNNVGAGTGTQNAIAAMAPTGSVEYNGNVWVVGADSITNHVKLWGAAGTQNSSVFYGGGEGNTSTAATEHYNGTGWTAGGNMIVARGYVAQIGDAENSVIAVGGRGASDLFPASKDCTEVYNGSTWSVAVTTPTERYGAGGMGTENAGLVTGNVSPTPGNTTTDEWDGTAWSTGGNLGTGRGYSATAGTQGKGLYISGYGSPAPRTCTEEYNKSFITTGSFGMLKAGYLAGDGSGFASTLPRSNNIISGSPQIADDVSGSFISGFNFGANLGRSFTGVSGSTPTPGVSGSTAHFSSSIGHPTFLGGVSGSSQSGSDFTPILQYQFGHIRGTMLGSTNSFSVGGNLGVARYSLGGAGVAGAALAFGGQTPASPNPRVTCTEEYNGSVWATANVLDNAGSGHSMGTGTQNAALVKGRSWGSAGSKTEGYDGTVWSELSNSSDYGFYRSSAGTFNAALSIGGREAQTHTEHFNGTAWSEGGTLNQGRQQAASTGLENAALAIGGPGSPSLAGNNTCTEHYNGTTWSVGGARITGNSGMAAYGGENEAAIVGGSTDYTNVEYYDGTSWSAGTDTPNERAGAGFGGTVGGGITFGGHASSPYPGLNTTEVFEVQYITTGSFGRIEVKNLHGDASSISSSLAAQYSILSSSADIKSDISGSFRSGIDLKGPITTQPMGAWTEVNRMINGRSQHAQIGGKSAAVVVGSAYGAAGAGLTEVFNGLVWTTHTQLPFSASRQEAAGDVGSELLFKGTWSGSGAQPYSSITMFGNGTSWNQGPYTNQDGQQSDYHHGGNIGSQNAALSTHGDFLPTEEWDGLAWITRETTPLGSYHAKAGVVNAALAMGGGGPSYSCAQKTGLWDGVSWSVVAPLNQMHKSSGAGGTTNDAILAGGYHVSPAFKDSTELFDGVTWKMATPLGTGLSARADGDGSSAGSSGVLATGRHSSNPIVNVWDVYYPSTGSFSELIVTGSIITDSFSLKSKSVNDRNTKFLLNGEGANNSINFSGSMGEISSSGTANPVSMSMFGNVHYTSSISKFGGTSIAIDGDGNYLKISGSHALDLGDTFTLEAWVYAKDVGSTYAPILYRGEAEYMFGINGGSTKEGRVYMSNANKAMEDGSFPLNQWVHIATTFDNGTLKWWQDGKLVTTHTSVTSPGTSNDAVFIGTGSGADTWFSGSIDQIRISDIVRYTDPFIPPGSFTDFVRIASGSGQVAPFSTKKKEPVTFKLPQFRTVDQPAILTQTLFQSNYSSSLATLSGSRLGRSGSSVGGYIKEENTGTVAGDMWFNKENNSLNFTWESSSYSGGVWTTGGAMLINNWDLGGTGLQNAALAIGGASDKDATQHYDGAAWSLGGLMINDRFDGGASGTQNAALAIGGRTPSISTATEEYNGASWSAGGALATATCLMGSAGTQNATLANGGLAPGAVTTAQKYDGSSWTIVGSMNTARYGLRTVGQQFHALSMGGNTSPTIVDETEEYNGSVWTEVADVLTDREKFGAGGDVNDAAIFGGRNPSIGNNVTCTEEWNGVTWTQRGTLNVGRRRLAGAGTRLAALAISGDDPGKASTEEYSGAGVYTNLKICAITGSQA